MTAVDELRYVPLSQTGALLLSYLIDNASL
jgi:hypothetical protein